MRPRACPRADGGAAGHDGQPLRDPADAASELRAAGDVIIADPQKHYRQTEDERRGIKENRALWLLSFVQVLRMALRRNRDERGNIAPLFRYNTASLRNLRPATWSVCLRNKESG